jgi:ribose-phosphate pyrophosphokinase
MDLHAPQIQGFFHMPVDHIMGAPILSSYYVSSSFLDEDLIVVSPDLGSVARTRSFAARLGVPMAIVDKRRSKANVSEVMNIIGDVSDRRCLLVDDMIDTAGTICHAAEALMDAGAKDVYACATHGVLSGPAVERLDKAPIKEIVLLDTIELPAEKYLDKIKVLSVKLLFAEAIERIYQRQPVSPLFDEAPSYVTPIGFQQRMNSLGE